jgi:hypothetical protein
MAVGLGLGLLLGLVLVLHLRVEDAAEEFVRMLRGRKARVGPVTLRISQIATGNSKGFWQLEGLWPDRRDWEMFETKAEASRAFNVEKASERRWRAHYAGGYPRPIRGRRGSSPSARRARSRRLP